MSLFKEEKEIKSLDEVEQHSIKYWLLDENGERTGKWVWIEINHEYGEIYYTLQRKIYRSQLYDFEVSGNYVRTWKTLNGAICFAKKTYSNWI